MGCYSTNGPGANVTFSCNAFEDNGSDGLLGKGAPMLDHKAFLNNLGAGLNNAGAAAVDVRNNWWGDPSGPSGLGPGAGDGVLNSGSGTVLFAPWAVAWPIAGCPAVVDAPQGSTPRVFMLHPCNPNPMSRSTVIRYDLSRGARVRLAIYNAMGREVAVVVNGWQEAGARSVRIDASRLESGIYFYEMRALGFRDTKAMVRIR